HRHGHLPEDLDRRSAAAHACEPQQAAARNGRSARRARAPAAERGPLYEEIADITIDTSGRQVKSIVSALKQRLATERRIAKGGSRCDPATVDTLEVS